MAGLVQDLQDCLSAIVLQGQLLVNRAEPAQQL